MSYFSWFVVSFFVAASVGVPSATAADAELISVPLKKAYIPTGFDDNDHVQLVVTGEFPDSCYKLGPVTAKVTAAKIEVTQAAYRDSGVCLDMIVPFNQVVDLDRLPSSNYEVQDTNSGKYLGNLPVVTAVTPVADDFVYAPVEEAMILEERGGKGPTLYLTGNFPSKRMKIKEVRVLNYHDVVVVQPIVEVSKSADAEDALLAARPRFEFKQALTNLPKGNFLLHVRSMNGKAVNKMEELETK